MVQGVLVANRLTFVFRYINIVIENIPSVFLGSELGVGFYHSLQPGCRTDGLIGAIGNYCDKPEIVWINQFSKWSEKILIIVFCDKIGMRDTFFFIKEWRMIKAARSLRYMLLKYNAPVFGLLSTLLPHFCGKLVFNNFIE